MRSLSELRAIEVQRIADERAAREQASAARLAALAEAEARARAEAEAQARAEHEAQLAIEQARLAAEREARLRIDAAAAAEQMRQQAALEQLRTEEELRLRRAALAKTRPTWMVAVTAIATLAAGALLWLALASHSTAQEAQERARLAQIEKDRAKEDAHQAQSDLARITQELQANSEAIKRAERQVELAQNQADRDKANEALRVAAAKQKAIEAARADAARKAWEAERRGGVHVSDDCKTGVLCK